MLIVLDNADSCTLRCISVNRLNEVLTGNSSGQMKVWDLRSYSNSPETSFTLSGGQVNFLYFYEEVRKYPCHKTLRLITKFSQRSYCK